MSSGLSSLISADEGLSTSLAGVSLTSALITDLPTELVLRVASFLPKIPFPCEDRKLVNPTFLRNCRNIKALSQTCQRFRDILIPLAWEILELCQSEVEGSPDSLEQYLADNPDMAELPR
jgi:hypothetical protein